MGIQITNGFSITKNAAAAPVGGLQAYFQTAPSSGTNWTDASGNNKNATIYGTFSYVSNNGGGIKLQNSSYTGDAYISVPYNFTKNTLTVEIVASFNPTSFWSTIWGNDSYFSNKGFFAYMTSSTSITYGAPNYAATKTITASNAIRHWIFVINGTTQDLYLNGSQIGTTDSVTAQTNFHDQNLFFGARHANNGLGATDKLNSNISANQPVFYQMRVYDKALSSSEVTTNFNEIKSQYGL